MEQKALWSSYSGGLPADLPVFVPMVVTQPQQSQRMAANPSTLQLKGACHGPLPSPATIFTSRGAGATVLERPLGAKA